MVLVYNRPASEAERLHTSGVSVISHDLGHQKVDILNPLKAYMSLP